MEWVYDKDAERDKDMGGCDTRVICTCDVKKKGRQAGRQAGTQVS